MTDVLNFIPVGRTARLPRGNEEIQVQTEYAPRPLPRITSCILVSGRLIHKVETPLTAIVTNIDEMARVERLLGRQHAAVYRVITSPGFRTDGSAVIELPDLASTGGIPIAAAQQMSGIRVSPNGQAHNGAAMPSDSASSAERLGANGSISLNTVSIADPLLSDSEKVHVQKRTTLERLYAIDGVEKIYTATHEGVFLSEKLAEEFRKSFSSIYKKMKEIIEVFSPLDQGRGREEGICELESRRLYMVSHFGHIYLIVMKRISSWRPIEEVIKEALYS